MTNFSSTYPNIAAWTRIASYGWIEIGQDDYSKSFIRVLDEKELCALLPSVLNEATR
jgi:hypothetical protein